MGNKQEVEEEQMNEKKVKDTLFPSQISKFHHRLHN